MPREFSIGNVLSLAFSVFFKNFLPFTAIGYVVQLPLTVWALAQPNESPPDALSGSYWASFAVVWVGALILYMIMTAAVVYGVFQQLHGVPVRIADCARIALRRFGAVLLVSIVTGLIIAVAALFCLVPGFFAACTFFVVVPAAVVERLGVSESVDRSRALTTGRRWEIFGIVLVIGAIVGVLNLVGGGLNLLLTPLLRSQVAATLLVSVLTTAGQTLNAVVAGVCYYLLRVDKEGFEIKDLAEVFA